MFSVLWNHSMGMLTKKNTIKEEKKQVCSDGFMGQFFCIFPKYLPRKITHSMEKRNQGESDKSSVTNFIERKI